MKYLCPKCKQVFEGQPNFCPNCGVKLNWPKEEPPASPVKEVVREPEPEAPRMEPLQPRHVYNDDDEPYYAPRQKYGYRKSKPYALVAKILMMSFSAMTGLFALICLLTYIGAFIDIENYTTHSGYKLAFYFSGSIAYLRPATCVGPLIGFVGVLAMVGLSIPRIIVDVKFFNAKEGTRKVARRRGKSIMWMILMPSILLVSIVFILLTNVFADTTKYTDVSLGGGAIATVVLMFFMMAFVIAEEIIVLGMLRLRPREPEYE